MVEILLWDIPSYQEPCTEFDWPVPIKPRDVPLFATLHRAIPFLKSDVVPLKEPFKGGCQFFYDYEIIPLNFTAMLSTRNLLNSHYVILVYGASYLRESLEQEIFSVRTDRVLILLNSVVQNIVEIP